MDVRCTRCGTEYEFDDALISERGTSVRCTQCSFQFRVFPPETKAVGPDEWVVLTNLGRRIVYRTLRELQNGIARGEVAREDLLARGTAPPRPLGAIAELDPLFASKAVPDRKSNTLTGVAPPPEGGRKRSASPKGPEASASSDATAASATEDNSALRAQHDTWSGVAPQAKITDLAELAARPSPPMRVSASRTVLGIGSPQSNATPELSPPVRVPVQSIAAGDMRVSDTGAGDSGVGDSGVAPAIAVENVSEPPKTRSFESDAPEEPEATQPLVAEGHTVPLAVSDAAESPHQPGDSEPPTLPPPPSGLTRDAIGERATTSLGLGLGAPAAADPVMADSSAVVTKPQPFGANQSLAEMARVAGSPGLPGPSEGPSRGTSSDRGDVVSAGLGALAEAEKSEVSADKSQDSLEPRTLISEPALQRAASEPQHPARIGSAPRHPRPVATETSRPDAVTRPPSRPHHPKPVEKPANALPRGIILISVVLLGGAAWVGMKLTALKLDEPKPAAIATAAPAASVRADNMTLGTGAPPATEVASPLASIDEALEAGDSEGALRLLDLLEPKLRATTDAATRRLMADSMSVDLLYWQHRLTPATQLTQLATLQETLRTRLLSLENALTECRKDPGCKANTQAAYWALCRMQNQPLRAQPPKQGSVDANGLYQLAMLDWVQVKTPDKKTLDRLTKARLTGVVLGARVTALIVALIDSGRLSEAQSELEQLSTQVKVHPHLELLNSYLRSVQQAPDAGATGESQAPEGADMDAFLREPDFRVRLQRAVQSLSRGEITKATKLFRSVLAERPNDTEAITGMGDIQRRRGDLTQARSSYDRALGLNGNYLPAMVGAADVRWQSGDRASAVGFYRRIVERVGDTPGYGQTASSRIREFEGVKEPEKAKTNSEGKPAKDDVPATADVPGKTP